ncbi:D-alanyl-D-alanine dipeptidase [candidate division TA06 bacterium B3_TA06]|uniref:D-alanyl-D-alanine dipeptidase n=1 Tax=candidate division TA06 bacterium B3_TA06 TaxID=2012487 RepID=A0A532V142_UNCT6|nr:MAG: D-alanyl-D-alanine dipeptidase [candidate division TA06 bacterium B3_TA06]
MPICNKCGAKNDEGSAFCEECGAKLIPQEQPAVQPKPESVEKRPKKTKVGLIVGISLGAVILAGVVLLIIFKPWRKSPQDITYLAKASASSALSPSRFGNYEPANVLDGISSTCWAASWADGGANAGIGMWIKLSFPREVKVTRIGLIPGYDRYGKDIGDRFYLNLRVRRARLEFSDGSSQKISLRDTREMQYFDVASVRTSFVKIVIEDVYSERAKDQDLCISEVEIYGVPVGKTLSALGLVSSLLCSWKEGYSEDPFFTHPISLDPATFVELVKLDSTIVLDIRYATENNFTHEVLYPEARCFLRCCVAESLVSVQRKANTLGYRLKVFDGYRPHRVQFLMWKLVPDRRYVADPNRGSRHNRGTAVDLTLVDSTGKQLDMGSAFDEFNERSHQNYTGLTKEQKRNRKLLTDIMTSTGFTTITSEWWHYDYYNWQSFPIVDVSFDSLRFVASLAGDKE